MLGMCVDEVDGNAKRRIATVAAAAGLLLSLLAFVSYRMITEHILRLSMANFAELSAHYERAMESTMETEWDALSGIAAHLAMQDIKDSEDLLFRMNTLRTLTNCLSLVLVSDDGRTAGANFVLSHDDALATICKSSPKRFAKLMASPRAATQGHAVDMVYGLAIRPLTVQGITYTHIAARTDMDSLQDGLKLDCYNGRGQVRVIDTDGSYIVKADRNRTPQERDNFFDIIATGRMPRGWDMERVFHLMRERKTFLIRFIDSGDAAYLLSLLPMNNARWYFIMKAPVDVFMQQSKSLMRVVIVLMAGAFVVLVAAVFMLFKRTFDMLIAERRHRDALHRALSLADQASRAKTTFLNNMSHDMRTPMNAIIGYTTLASSHVTNTVRVKDYLSKISQASDHLLSLINDVLDMSRIEAGKVSIDERPEHMSDILNHIRNIVLADIHAKNLDLFIDMVEVTNENIVCDRLHLTQVLLNLMGNAMKFTASGGTVSLIVAERPGKNFNSREYAFRVRDTGIGMSREFMNRVFEPFARERSSTVSGVEGTGLGLSITRNLVEMMGGTITLQSEQGKGSEFTVTLEFRLHNEGTKIEAIAALKGARALVIDDESEVCHDVARMLDLMGMRTDWTVNGKEAFSRSEAAARLGDPYKVYFIDWLMPDINGVQVAASLRHIIDKDAIMILSAYDWADVESDAREAGIVDFVSKPLFAAEVRSILCRAIGEKESESVNVGIVAREKEGRYERLLLVEDNELNREIAVEILKEAGFEMDTAKDGTEAVQIMQTARPGEYTAILMDVQMPIMDGYEATRRIRKLPDPLVASVPIIALTANVFEEDKEKAFSVGMDAYMSKPIAPKALLETLRQVVDHPLLHDTRQSSGTVTPAINRSRGGHEED